MFSLISTQNVTLMLDSFATVTAVDYLTRGTGSDAARGLRQGGPSTGLHVGGQRGRQKPRGK